MGQLHRKVSRVLRQHLPAFQDALEDLPGGRISGVVISSAFEEMDHQARQKKLYAILQQELTAQELTAVGAIAALTPAEATVKAG